MRENKNLSAIASIVSLWHKNNGFIEKFTDSDMNLKLSHEITRLSESIYTNTNKSKSIGKVLLTLINICERNKLSLSQCLSEAYEEAQYKQ